MKETTGQGPPKERVYSLQGKRIGAIKLLKRRVPGKDDGKEILHALGIAQKMRKTYLTYMARV